MKDQTIIENEAENKDLHNASDKKEKEKVDPKKEFFSWVRIFVFSIEPDGTLALIIRKLLMHNAKAMATTKIQRFILTTQKSH